MKKPTALKQQLCECGKCWGQCDPNCLDCNKPKQQDWERKIREIFSNIGHGFDITEEEESAIFKINRLFSKTLSSQLSTIQKEIEGMKYQWDKPIDEMPAEWYAHNQALSDVLEKVKKL